MPGMGGQLPLDSKFMSNTSARTGGQIPVGGMKNPGIGGQIQNPSSAGVSDGSSRYESYQRQALNTYLQNQGQKVMNPPKRVGGFLGFGGKLVPQQPAAAAAPRSVWDIAMGRPREPERVLSPLEQLKQDRSLRDQSRLEMKELQKEQMKLQEGMSVATRRNTQQRYAKQLKRLEEKSIKPLTKKLEEQERNARPGYFR